MAAHIGASSACIICFILAMPGTKHIVDVAFVKGEVLGTLGGHPFTFMAGKVK
jgi:hypothetical protein